MEPAERERFEFLKSGRCVPADYIRGFYGLELPFQDQFAADFSVWKSGLARRDECNEGRASRYELEAFLKSRRLLSLQMAGASMGMTAKSLAQLVGDLDRLGMRPARYRVYLDIVSASLADDLTASIPAFKFRTFGNHDDWCRRMHDELATALKWTPEPLWCETSRTLNETPLRYAEYYDCLTLKSVSAHHVMWLDFRKPLSLSPDRCSKLFYAENRDLLRPYAAGTGEPHDIDPYLRTAGEAVHG